MNMIPWNKIIKRAALRPKNLFLIDGLGALLSAFLLGFVLVEWEEIIGIPTTTLYVLAILPLFFFLFDVYSYFQKNKPIGPLLKGIAVINVLYCCLSLGLAFFHAETITPFGWLYIIIEIVIVLALAMLEMKVGKNQ